jgi:thiol:disulfide interchange protein
VTLPNGIEPDQLKAAAIVALLLLALALFIALRMIRKMVTRVVLAGLLVAAGAFVYAQRDDLDACQKKVRAQLAATGTQDCTCEFAGVKVKVPDCPVAREPFG